MKTPNLLRFLSLALVLTLVGAFTAQAESRDGVFVHVSHGSEAPQRVAMALTMANIFADDHPVLVYFDISGVEVVTGGEGLDHRAYEKTAELLTALADKGAILMACPSCLAAAGKGEEDLVAGVELADKSRFLNFTSGRILTFDY